MGIPKHFTPEFKREVMQLLESGSRPASEIARELGIARNQLCKWQTELRAHGSGPSLVLSSVKGDMLWTSAQNTGGSG
jgi:transposase-like protein